LNIWFLNIPGRPLIKKASAVMLKLFFNQNYL